MYCLICEHRLTKVIYLSFGIMGLVKTLFWMFNRIMILSYQQPLSPKESLKHRFHEKCMKALSIGNFKASCVNACLLFWIVLEIRNANLRNEAKYKNATHFWLAKVKTPSCPWNWS